MNQVCMLARISLVCLCFANFNAYAVHAEQVDPNLYILVTGDNYYPFSSSEVPQGGWSKAIVTMVFAKMQESIEIDTLPWGRGLKWAYAGHYRGAFPYVHTEVRAKDFFYSNPINTVSVRIYVNANSKVTKISELQGKSLCLPYGYSMDSWSSQFFEKYKFLVNRAKSAEGCAQQVLKNWSDFGFINSYFSEERLSNRFGSLNEIRILDQSAGEVPLYFIVSKKVPEAKQIIERFNLALAELEKSGDKAQIDKQFIYWMRNPKITSAIPNSD